jgi:hypothetical protein
MEGIEEGMKMRPAPLVAASREALARLFGPWAWDYGNPDSGAVRASREQSLAKADAAIASGIVSLAADRDRAVRDAAVKALRDFALSGELNTHASIAADQRADRIESEGQA